MSLSEPAKKKAKTSNGSASAAAESKPGESSKLAPLFRPATASDMKWNKNVFQDGLVSCYHGTYKSPAASSKKSARDWKLLSAKVKPALEKAHEDGFKIVIFTNQNYTGEKLTWVRPRIASIVEAIGVPLDVFAALLKDENRKPKTDMWDAFVRYANDGVAPDLEQCVFVGDAAGRPGDHSAADRDFARGVGLPFKTPEQYFDGRPA